MDFHTKLECLLDYAEKACQALAFYKKLKIMDKKVLSHWALVSILQKLFTIYILS
jgi:hypothetical protein